MTSSCIPVNAGGLEFHGEPKVPTWTVLAATVNAGDNTITVEADTNWIAGDEIVIATSHYSSLETEVRTIRAVSNRGSTFTLTSPLDHKHLGETTGIAVIMTSSNGNIFRFTGPLFGEFTGHRWIPLTKASEVELWCFLWSVPEKTVEQTIEVPAIWDAIALIMTSL